MNVEEEIEKAFIAGAEFANCEVWAYGEHIELKEIKLAATQYINTRALNGSNEPISS